ncbi:hypothetical protein C4577_00210 [Candidatus Parcubacteria bacterium]|nr:MAG: hypothetical protein C4577_00210 [Candidatus Parcubacteria bacterium]
MSNGETFFIQESLVDPHVIISEKDQKFIETVEKVIKVFKGETVTPELISQTIHSMFPGRENSSNEIREFRSWAKAIPLGEYFQPVGDVPYMAVCIHNALLAQAVASCYGLHTSLLEFSFDGQKRNEVIDNEVGLHASLRVLDKDKSGMILDPQKGTYEPEEKYWKRFINPTLIHPTVEPVIFTPDSQVIISRT